MGKKYSRWPLLFGIILSVLVSAQVAFANLTFTGTSISGDTNSAIDATGTISIGASSATGITIGRSGITATFPGAVTITGTTTTLQNLVVSGACTGCGVGNFTAGGDLSGSSTSQTVIGLQGRAVSSTAPSTNQILTWNGAFWTPANTGSGITAINGLSNSTTSVVAGANITVTTSSPNTITITGTGAASSITINSLTTSTFQIVGTANQITVATSSPNVLTLTLPQSIATGSSPSFANLLLSGNATTSNLTITSLGSSGNPCLSISAAGAVATTTCGSGSGITAINGITTSTFSFQGSGLTVATSAPNVITYTFTNPGYVTAASSVTWTAAQTFNATTTFLGPIVESSTGAGSIQLTEGTCPSGSSGSDILCADSTLHALKSSFNGGSFVVIPQLAGDLGNTASTPKVVGLQGVTVSSTAPTSNQCLVYNGTTWAPGSCGGSLSGGQANYFPLWLSATTLGTSTLQAATTSIVTTGGLAVGTTTNQSAGNLLVTGNVTTTNLSVSGLAGASGCLSVDATGAVTTSTCSGSTNATQLQGVAVSNATPSTNQVLAYNGSQWAPAAASANGSTTYSPYYTYGASDGAGSTAVSAINTVILYGYPIVVPVQFNSLAFFLGVADASTTDLYDIGLYSSTGTLLADAGAAAYTTTGAKVASTTQGMVTLLPGKYYVAITGVSTTLKFDTVASQFTYLGASQRTATVGGVLTATTTVPADVWTVASIPSLMLFK